ncbi:MAG: MGMT family protein [Bacilli bacterium]|jgi:methylated-DNA-protein-cysteine methyltransferase related protein
MTNFEKEVYEVVKKIPFGTVLTYKDIAIKLGDEKLARAVGNALHKNTDYKKVPCYRVVNSKGDLSINYKFNGREGQKILLTKEGVLVDHNRVNLFLFRKMY